MRTATDYEHAVKSAITLGVDTDTTACNTSGLAGLVLDMMASLKDGVIAFLKRILPKDCLRSYLML